MPNATDIMTSEYTQTYSTYSGCDIVASFGNAIIGELQAITYSISREKAPLYTMGSAEPRSFSRGKRGIAGTLVFTVFDRDALIEELKKQARIKIHRIGADRDSGRPIDADRPMSIEEWDDAMTGKLKTAAQNRDRSKLEELVANESEVVYADEIPPFDITVTFANEYGQTSSLVIYGVEILNEGVGFSIDSVTTEKACTFVARKIDHMKPHKQQS